MAIYMGGCPNRRNTVIYILYTLVVGTCTTYNASIYQVIQREGIFREIYLVLHGCELEGARAFYLTHLEPQSRFRDTLLEI